MKPVKSSFKYLSVVAVVMAACVFFIPLSGCSFLKNALKAKFDPVGLQYAVTLNGVADALLAKAQQQESYMPYSNDVYQLMSNVEEAYEHARTQKQNNTIVGMWNVMRNPNGNRLGKIMADWKKYDKLDPDTVATYKKWIDDDFKEIAKLEGAKKK